MTENEFLNQINENTGLIRRLINMYADSIAEEEDMFQEILLRSWISKDQFRGESKFSTWLYKVSLNSILTGMNKKNTCRIYQKDKTDEKRNNLYNRCSDGNLKPLQLPKKRGTNAA